MSDYTATGSIEGVKRKGFLSTATGLTDSAILDELNDSLRSYIVPFLKTVRDEWFVSGSEAVTPDANARIPMPNSVASTIRAISWNNNGNYVPLVRIEPENQFAFIGANSSSQPYGYMLKAYEIQILPTNIGSVSVRIDFMERPVEMVEASSAAEIVSGGSPDYEVAEVPLAWQSTPPTTVDVVSGVSPFSLIDTVTVSSIVATTISVSGGENYPAGSWFADAGYSPFPNVPIEFHPLLQRDVISTIYGSTGDKRLDASVKMQMKMEQMIRSTMAPRTQGSARPVVNKNAVGMRSWGGGWW